MTATASGGTWQVTVEPRLDGVPTSLFTAVAIGPDGNVESASGQVGDPERVGTYPLLDSAARIERANAASRVDLIVRRCRRLRRRRGCVRPP